MRQQVVVRRILVSGLVVLAAAAAWVWLAPAPPKWTGDDSVINIIINITYPYVASPERARQIRTGFPQIATGASVAQVTEVLGIPDEVHPLYEPRIFRPRRIGTTYWYFLAKPVADKNTADRGVRVAFDLDGRVSGLWGFGDNEAEPHATPHPVRK
jgi:hypothetical protein